MFILEQKEQVRADSVMQKVMLLALLEVRIALQLYLGYSEFSFYSSWGLIETACEGG